VALSDVYYGDGSSVGALFKAAGKGVVGQEFDAQIYIYGLYDDGNFIWFIDYFNILYRYNKKNKKTEYIKMIAEQNNYASCLGIAKNNDKLYFAPCTSDKIIIFDMNKKDFERIDFKYDGEIYGKCSNVVIFKNFIYFIPHRFPAIMRLNMDTKEIEYFSEWVNEISKLQVSKQEEWKSIIFWSFCVVDAEIALLICGANAIMFFNMETGNYEINSIGEKIEQYNNICFDGQNYYISPFYKNYIIKWNRKSNEILTIKFPNTFSRRENKLPNFSVKYINGYVWLFPCAANNAYKININTNEIIELPEFVNHFEDKNLDCYYSGVSANENYIYLSTRKKGFAEFNASKFKLNFIKPDLGEESLLFSRLYDNCMNKFNKLTIEIESFGKKIWECFRRL
jgi:hypothetical protein